MTRRGDWIQTQSGRRFYSLDARPEDVDLRDIAHALSLVCRFAGHCRTFFSVAEHSVRVARSLLPVERPWTPAERRLALAGLLHDASEAYLGDVPRPIKRLPEMAPYREAEARLEAVIAERFGLSHPWPEAVKLADARALATERRDLLAVQRDDWGHLPEPWPERIEPQAPEVAHLHFLGLFFELGGIE